MNAVMVVKTARRGCELRYISKFT